MSGNYRIKFFKGAKLILDRTWDPNQYTREDMAYEAAAMIEEAVQVHPPDPSAAEGGK